MQNVFSIPPYVLLEEDNVHVDLNSVSHKDVEKLEQEIKDLQNEIAAVSASFVFTTTACVFHHLLKWCYINCNYHVCVCVCRCFCVCRYVCLCRCVCV